MCVYFNLVVIDYFNQIHLSYSSNIISFIHVDNSKSSWSVEQYLSNVHFRKYSVAKCDEHLVTLHDV